MIYNFEEVILYDWLYTGYFTGNQRSFEKKVPDFSLT